MIDIMPLAAPDKDGQIVPAHLMHCVRCRGYTWVMYCVGDDLHTIHLQCAQCGNAKELAP